MLKPNKKHSGVSLIELMVAIAIISILAVIGVPAYTTWIQNSQIRTAAQSISQGLQRARAEAVSRNLAVTFTLVLDGTDFWSVTENTSGNVKNTSENVIESKPAGELNTNVTFTGSGNATIAAGTAITFTSLGGIRDSDTSTPAVDNPLPQIDIYSSALSDADADADATKLRVVVSNNGSVLLCDPSVSTSGDPRKCP